LELSPCFQTNFYDYLVRLSKIRYATNEQFQILFILQKARILVFLPDIETAKKVVEEMQARNKNKINIIVKGDNTKQGRYILNIEGDIPKDHALAIRQIVDNYNSSIEVVAG
jgi:hypothetical protein